MARLLCEGWECVGQFWTGRRAAVFVPLVRADILGQALAARRVSV